MRDLLRTGVGATLVLLIMLIGSLVLWIGTPLLWLWVGSQVQGATSSLGTALGVSFIGVVATIMLLAGILAKLSNVYQANRRSRGLPLPAGQLVVADAVRVHATLFGDPVPEHAAGRGTDQIVLYAVAVEGVPAIHVEEALWVSTDILRAG